MSHIPTTTNSNSNNSSTNHNTTGSNHTDDGIYNSKYLRREILYCIEHYSVLILNIGGSSSSNNDQSMAATQVPLYLYEHGYGSSSGSGGGDGVCRSSTILITQPNSHDTISCAQRTMRVLQQQQQQQQSTRTHMIDIYLDPTTIVGCTVPFQNPSSYHYQDQNMNHDTCHYYKIRYVTHDVLIQEISTTDPLLMQYPIIIVHQVQLQHRTASTEIVLGLLRKIQQHRQSVSSSSSSSSSTTTATNLKIILFIHTNSIDTHENAAATTSLLQYFTGRENAQRAIELSSSSSSSVTTTTTIIPPNRSDNTNPTGMILSMLYDHKQQQQQQQQQPLCPVNVHYLSQPTFDYISTMIETIHYIIITNNPIITNNNNNHNPSNNVVGDILCFVPTYIDVTTAIHMSQEYFDQQSNNNNNNNNNNSTNKKQQHHQQLRNNVDFLPFSTSLPLQIQEQILQPHQQDEAERSKQQRRRRRRRVIFTNLNVEMTSITTIPNIQYVIDSGYTEMMSSCRFDPITGLNHPSTTIPISQYHAQQRSSYAMVTSSASLSTFTVGQCYRLYTELYMTETMIKTTPLPITCTDITSIILVLKSIGIDNILTFDFINQTVPNIESIGYGLETLYALGAIDDTTTMTTMGYDMVQLGVEPRMARMLIESIRYNCMWEVATIASVIQATTTTNHQYHLLQTKPKHQQQHILDYDDAMSNVADISGDHISYLNIFQEIDQQYNIDYNYCTEHFLQYNTVRQCLGIRKYLVRILQRLRHRIDSVQPPKLDAATTSYDRSPILRRCITTGYIMNVAKLHHDGQYYSIRKDDVMVVPSKYSFYMSHSKMSSEYIVFNNSGGNNHHSNNIEIQHVSSIEAKWLREIVK